MKAQKPHQIAERRSPYPHIELHALLVRELGYRIARKKRRNWLIWPLGLALFLAGVAITMPNGDGNNNVIANVSTANGTYGFSNRVREHQLIKIAETPLFDFSRIRGLAADWSQDTSPVSIRDLLDLPPNSRARRATAVSPYDAADFSESKD
jgi:hypothetical protein